MALPAHHDDGSHASAEALPVRDATALTDQEDPILLDCSTCLMRNVGCADCVVSVLISAPDSDWDAEERQALSVLSDSGLVPPLRLVKDHPRDQP